MNYTTLTYLQTSKMLYALLSIVLAKIPFIPTIIKLFSRMFIYYCMLHILFKQMVIQI